MSTEFFAFGDKGIIRMRFRETRRQRTDIHGDGTWIKFQYAVKKGEK